MVPTTFLDGRVRLHPGDCLEALASMESDSVDCVVTSPPYWGLRDYGINGQIGMEPTLAEHLDKMVAVFEAVKRVLKPTGTVWLNYGDCYATNPNGRSAADTKAAGNDDRTFRDKPFSTVGGTLKPKDLCMLPNRLAIALQDAGWWVRSEIVWGKSNPMPESIKDRPATSHEKIFMLTKSARYFYDAEAVRQQSITNDMRRPYAPGQVDKRGNGHDRGGGSLRKNADKQRGHSRRSLRNYEHAPLAVWPIATKPFSEAHFATFPPELAERCILAGCPKDGIVLDPFGGAGTTALVALRHGRNASLIELNPEYAEMARRRIETEWRVPQKPAAVDFGPLFTPTAEA